MTSPHDNYFRCDSCGDTIPSPDDGMIEWISDPVSYKEYDFRIIHNKQQCSKHKHTLGLCDNYISLFLSHNGLAYLLSKLDVGSILAPSHQYGTCHIEDMRSFTEIFRRLTLPNYEISRQYHQKAINDGLFIEANEVTPYTSVMISKIIEKYHT